MKTKAYFELIDIMDDYDPYPTLLGIDWAFDNNVVLNLKKKHVSFKTNSLCVITPLDPNEGDKYNELVHEDAQILVIENIYKIIRCREDYVNPLANGELIWRSMKSYDTDLDDTMER